MADTKPYPAEFWILYDRAREQAEKTEEWNMLEMQRLSAQEQSGISDEHEELMVGAVEQEWTNILFEMYKLMKASQIS